MNNNLNSSEQILIKKVSANVDNGPKNFGGILDSGGTLAFDHKFTRLCNLVLLLLVYT